ncbi:phage shock protein PspA [bacterium]|nr:phage shock protein PspA [bacterium]
MGIFTRLRDIVSANLNAMLDCAEDPEKMVRMMIQEMEDTLVEVKSSCAAVMADQKKQERQLAATRDEIEGWDGRARLAVQKQREDLARAALVEKQRYADRARVLEEEMQRTKQAVDDFQADIAQLEKKLSDAREKQRSIIHRRTAAMARRDAQTRIRAIDTSEAFARFEAYENGIDRLEAEAGLVDALRPKTPSLREEFNALEHAEDIEQELQRLKNESKPS